MIIDPYTWLQLPIQHLTLLTDDTLSVRMPKPAHYDYRAGQYAVIRAQVGGAPLLRQYSFASCPSNDFLEFLIQREPDGTVTNWFHDESAVGTTVEISQPFGSFGIDGEQHPRLFIAGRVGVAPFVSIIRDELSKQRGDGITLLYSARSATAFCYPELLSSVATSFIDTETGTRLDDATLTDHLTPTTRVYLCGSKQFVDSLTRRLLDLDVPKEHLKKEFFTLQ